MNIDNNDVSYASPTTAAGEAPPPYEEQSRPASTMLTDLTDITDAALARGRTEPIPGGPFPLVFNVYRSRGYDEFLMGEHFDRPCNAVVVEGRLKGSTMYLHKGIDSDSPILATAHGETAWTRHSVITIPNHVNSEGPPITEQLRTHAGWKHVSHSFNIDVSNAQCKSHQERFEWRMSHGKEVKELDDWSWGWKLVRLGDKKDASSHLDQRPGSGPFKRSDDREHGLTSDGREIVAVWAANSKFSKNKMGTFRFMSSGASGELGEEWAIMAVATILRLWSTMRAKTQMLTMT